MNEAPPSADQPSDGRTGGGTPDDPAPTAQPDLGASPSGDTALGGQTATTQREDTASSAVVNLLKAPEFSLLPAGEKTDIDKIETGTKEESWNPDQYAAFVQSSLAFRLIWVLAGVLLGGAGLLVTTKWTGLMAKDVTDFFGIAFGAVVTLTTAATSFWFGTQRERARTGRRNGPNS
jgi:hypothetical protein